MIQRRVIVNDLSQFDFFNDAQDTINWLLACSRTEDAAALHRASLAHSCNRSLAADGLTSYRCRNRFGWTMIGARSDKEAFKEAQRSWEDSRLEDLQRWNGREYISVESPT